MKKILVSALIVFVFLLMVSPVKADCSGQYGQYGEPCDSFSIVVDKMVGKPGTSTDSNSYEYVDNLSVSDPRFSPEQLVFFKIKIKNTSTTKLVGMAVKDDVPSYLEPLEGPGKFDAAARTVSWDAGDFDVDEEKTFYMKMRVVPTGSLPSNQGLFCVTNLVKADSANAHDEDTAQLCIEKQVTSVVTVPSAGPEMGLGLLALQFAGIAVGLYLKKNG